MTKGAFFFLHKALIVQTRQPTNPRQSAFPQNHYRLASPRRQEGCSLMPCAHPKVLPIKGQFRLIKNYYTATQPLPTTSSRALSTYEKLSAE